MEAFATGSGRSHLVCVRFPDRIRPDAGTPPRSVQTSSVSSPVGFCRSQETLAYSVLHKFTGEADGALSLAPLILDKAGNLYGATLEGGDLSSYGSGCGVVFKVDLSGEETVLYTPTALADGANPQTGLVSNKAGNGGTYESGLDLLVYGGF